MVEITFTPEDIAYLEEKRRSVQLVVSYIFDRKVKQYLEKPPTAGIFSVRLGDGSEFTIANYDWFKHFLGQDFTDCLELEIEHEAQELLLTRGQETVDPFGPAHYEAIKRTMIRADKEGLLDRYLEFKEQTFKTIVAFGDTHAIEELEHYTKTAAEIRTSKLL